MGEGGHTWSYTPVDTYGHILLYVYRSIYMYIYVYTISEIFVFYKILKNLVAIIPFGMEHCNYVTNRIIFASHTLTLGSILNNLRAGEQSNVVRYGHFYVYYHQLPSRRRSSLSAFLSCLTYLATQLMTNQRPIIFKYSVSK